MEKLDSTPESTTLLNNGEPLKSAMEVLPMFWRKGKQKLIVRDIPADMLANGEPLVLKLAFGQVPVLAGSQEQAFIG